MIGKRGGGYQCKSEEKRQKKEEGREAEAGQKCKRDVQVPRKSVLHCSVLFFFSFLFV
jgi:hypothetical protein